MRAQELLFVRDTTNQIEFLIDTGAAISVLPASVFAHKNSTPEKTKVTAANGTPINTYGEVLLKVDIGLRRNFHHVFVIADTQNAILGADFIAKNKLKIDLARRQLSDPQTCVAQEAGIARVQILGIAENVDGPHMEILKRFPSLTSEDDRVPAVKHSFQHTIPTSGRPPFFRPRKLNPKMGAIAKTAIEKMLDEGIIRPSKGPYASPLHIVAKKSGWRLVGDYRALNGITKRDAYPLPYLQDFSMQLNGKKIFSKIDLRDAYHQLPVAEEDIEKTAICTPFGNYEFVRMSFGLTGAAQCFQRFIDAVLGKVTRQDTGARVTLFAYIDDIIIASESREAHEQDLEAVFQRLAEYNLKISLRKCEFAQEDIEFLGHAVSEKGIIPLPEKVAAINEFPLPESFKQLRKFLGMVNYFHRLIPNAAGIMAPLNDLLKGYKKAHRNRLINWSDDTRKAFTAAKKALSDATWLAFPDTEAQLGLFCDASGIAVAGSLQQFKDGGWQPLGFFSKKMNKLEQLGSAFARELLAVYLAIKHFHHWLEGTNITIYSDHKPLIAAMGKPIDRPNLKEARQMSFIAQYSPKFEHISGGNNIVADALSRPQIDAIETTSMLDHELRTELIRAQGADNELKQVMDSNSALKIKVHNELYCDTSTGRLRPFLPKSMREKVFKLVHNLAHPGVKQSSQLISHRFVWPNMKRDIKLWVNSCYHCQLAKVTRHNHTVIKSIPNDVPKFGTVHIDLVGPLPVNKGCAYLLTMIDRFTRWAEVIPLPDIRAETVANAFIAGWVARFGVPNQIVCDRGAQFQSGLFKNLLQQLGCKHSRTTSYNPRCNGLIERYHRQLKSALKNGEDHSWLERLPLILLGLRVSFKAEIGCSPSEMVYGYPIKLPVDMLGVSGNSEIPADQYLSSLKKAMNRVAAPVTRPPSNDSNYLDRKLQFAHSVFVKIPNPKGMQPSYKGPYRVVERGDKFFKLEIGDEVDTVSIDRLKTAHIMEEPPTSSGEDPEDEWHFTNAPVEFQRVINPNHDGQLDLPEVPPNVGEARVVPGTRQTRVGMDTGLEGSVAKEQGALASETVTLATPRVTRSGRASNIPQRFQAGGFL